MEASPTIFPFLLPAESFRAAEQEGEHQTEPAGLPGLRKPVEHSERTKQGIHRAEDEMREPHRKHSGDKQRVPLSVQQCTDQTGMWRITQS